MVDCATNIVALLYYHNKKKPTFDFIFRYDKINVEWRDVKMRQNIWAVDTNPSDKYEITSKR